VRTIATPLRVGEEQKPVRRGPLRGEHTEEVLMELCGYTRERVLALRRAGVIGNAGAAADRQEVATEGG
jgi:crotonobetainyl-CoA:carnitine CoA-transferase CaiB-like acyl-CoA transferase